jgi:hypothetical protein
MEQEGANMAQQGMEHWRRAVRWTFVGIFAVALAGGILSRVTSDNSAFATIANQARHEAANTSRSAVSHTSTSSSASAASSSASGSSASSSHKSAPVAPQTAARGTAVLLRLSDLPAGWTSGGTPVAPTRATPWSPQLASCVGIPSRLAKIAPTKVQSPDFSSADKVDAVEDSVSVYPSAAQAQAEFAAMAGSKTTGCMNRVASSALQKSMQQEAGATTTVGVVSFAGLPAGAATMHLAGFTVTIPIARGGRVLTVTSTQVDFVAGSLLHQVTFNGNGAAFPPVLEEQLLATVKDRT